MAKLSYLHKGEFGPQEGGEHEDEKNASCKLKVALWLIVTKSRHTSKQRFSLLTALGQDEEQGSNQGKVSEQKLQIPQYAVCNGLHMKSTFESLSMKY